MAKNKTGGSTTGAKKTECPLTKKQFADKAKPVTININGVPMIADVKQFSTGSFGWYMNGKTVIEVDGVAVSVQVGLNMTVVNSKEAAAS